MRIHSLPNQGTKVPGYWIHSWQSMIGDGDSLNLKGLVPRPDERRESGRSRRGLLENWVN